LAQGREGGAKERKEKKVELIGHFLFHLFLCSRDHSVSVLFVLCGPEKEKDKEKRKWMLSRNPASVFDCHEMVRYAECRMTQHYKFLTLKRLPGDAVKGTYNQ
jgi:hypothetical protein